MANKKAKTANFVSIKRFTPSCIDIGKAVVISCPGSEGYCASYGAAFVASWPEFLGEEEGEALDIDKYAMMYYTQVEKLKE